MTRGPLLTYEFDVQFKDGPTMTFEITAPSPEAGIVILLETFTNIVVKDWRLK
jgi:hypothetical protein